ncbi:MULTISPECIES: DUF3883 domain-containing protein [unclassified Massilia]|uniref:DUF3883 domain-containing protein n=1 Tax=unclassified Massilia TaxID=2609279 RepID=UPI00068DF78D|nr:MULTISPECIES: DUF3883 domain-containing protein [unclassified Massilia]AWG46015.1 hypothetical protein AM586_28335 [Massilia sp. WG5]
MSRSEDTITTAELRQATAGGDSYIRTKNNIVVGLALRPDLNPAAPSVVLVGKGPRIVETAALFYKQRQAVPTFLKEGINKWRFVGRYRAARLSRTARDIATHGASRPLGSVTAVLFLEQEAEPEVTVQGGCYGDAESRKQTEEAAIRFVRAELRRRGFTVVDRQRDNCGYDLLATSLQGRLLVEVKGTTSMAPRFVISRNEYRCSLIEPDWRLFVVTSARNAPCLHEYDADAMAAAFALDPLAWEATPTP